MKKFIFSLALSCLSVAGFAQNQDAPFRVKVVSNEINTINRRMNIELRIYADADAKLNHEVYLQSTEGLQLKDHDPKKAYGKIKEYLEAGDSTTIILTINYNKRKLSPNHQNFRLFLKNLKPGNFPTETWAFIYFTPYKTIEIWNHDDFARLKRAWNTTQDEEPTTKRVFINRKDIPASDLTDTDFMDPNVPKSYKTIPGLDYAIPMHFMEEDGRAENPPVKDKPGLFRATSYSSLDQ